MVFPTVFGCCGVGEHLREYMKPRLSRSLRRILAGMVVCGHTAFAANMDWNSTSEPPVGGAAQMEVAGAPVVCDVMNLGAMAEQGSINVQGLLVTAAPEQVNALPNVAQADADVRSWQGMSTPLMPENAAEVGKQKSSGPSFSSSSMKLNASTSSGGAILADTANRYGEGMYALAAPHRVSQRALSANAKAGARVLAAAFGQRMQQTGDFWEKNPDLVGVMEAMGRSIYQGNKRAANKLATAVSGAAVTALGAAWRDQMERQLRSIRNRTTTLSGGMPCELVLDEKGERCLPPPYTVWANAEMDYHHLDNDGNAPGYKLNSLGGTVGFSAQSSEDMTLGAAFTGMAGRISSKGSGSNASGDLDAYYASFFARKEMGCVTHTLIGTVGFADAMLKRYVDYGTGHYGTKGSADGIGYGLMYEMATTYRVNPEYMSNAWWQPVFNVSYIHSSMDAYTESGSDAALRVGKQDRNNVIFGLGARLQTQVDHEWLNRSAIWEMRVLGKATAGNRRQKTSVSFPGVSQDAGVRGAEESVVGVELGIGMTMPLGYECGSVFMDCSAEFGNHYSSVNGVLGYRIDF